MLRLVPVDPAAAGPSDTCMVDVIANLVLNILVNTNKHTAKTAIDLFIGRQVAA